MGCDSMMVPGRFQLTHFPGLYITHGSAFLNCIHACAILLFKSIFEILKIISAAVGESDSINSFYKYKACSLVYARL